MYFDLKQLSTTPAMVTRVGFTDGAGTLYLGLYVTWDAAVAAIYKSTDHGITWSKLASTSGFMYTNGVVAGTSDGTNLYLYRQDNTLLRSSDGGVSWTAITKHLGAYDVGGAAVPGSPPDTAASMCWDGTYLYLAGGVCVWRSNDQGETWQAVLLWDRRGFAFVAASPTCVIIGAKTMSGKRSFDHGVTWEDAPGLVSNVDWRVGAYRNGYFFFGIGDGYIYGTNDNGTTVTRCSESAVNGQVILAPPDNNMLYFGWYGYSSLYVACALAPRFTPTQGSVLSDGTHTITATSSSPASHVAMTSDGTAPTLPTDITTLPATGSTSISTPTTLIKAVAAVEPDGVVDLEPSAVVSASYQFRTPTPVIDPSSGSFPSPKQVSISDVATGEVVIVYTLDGSDPAYTGDSFDAGYSAGYGSTLAWRGIAIEEGTGKLFAVSLGSGIGTDTGSVWYCAGSDASAWSQITTIGAAGLGDWCDVSFGASGTVFVSAYIATSLWRSQDSGVTWSNVLTEAVGSSLGTDLRFLYSDASGVVIMSGTDGLIRSADAGETWTLPDGLQNTSCGRVVRDAASSSLFVTTDIGLFKSTDSGASWSLVSASITTASSCLLVRGSLILAYASFGSLMRSVDAGVSWSPTTYLAGPDSEAFVVTSDGIVYGTGGVNGASSGMTVSYDLGLTWAQMNSPVKSSSDLCVDSADRVWGFDNDTNHFPFRYARGWVGKKYSASFDVVGSGAVSIKALARKLSTNYVNSEIATATITLEQLRQLFVGKDGTWHPVLAEFAGSANAWHPTQISVGNSGAWK